MSRFVELIADKDDETNEVDKISIDINEIVAVEEIGNNETEVYTRQQIDKVYAGYTIAEPYEEVMRKIEQASQPW